MPDFADNKHKETLCELRKKINALRKKAIIYIKKEDPPKNGIFFNTGISKINHILHQIINKNDLKTKQNKPINLKKFNSKIKTINLEPTFFNNIVECIISDYTEDVRLFKELKNPNIRLNKVLTQKITNHKNTIKSLEQHSSISRKTPLDSCLERGIWNEINFKMEIKSVGFPDLNHFDLPKRFRENLH